MELMWNIWKGVKFEINMIENFLGLGYVIFINGSLIEIVMCDDGEGCNFSEVDCVGVSIFLIVDV